jgi:hypothetical protein
LISARTSGSTSCRRFSNTLATHVAPTVIPTTPFDFY